MSRLTDLIREAKRLDPALGEALDTEVRHLTERRAFGLNFERHAPEVVDLVGRPVCGGDKVRMLPPRGEAQAPDSRLWRATGARETPQGRVVQLRDLRSEETAEHPIGDLMPVAESTDVIYPGLVSTGRIERGGATPFHTVINSENLHALKALLYTHRGKIDCIYIDPPYNTGNDDWIYSDKYVASDDLYRHSKWLSFMERRLEIAKELLADTGVIIVAIGDDEHHRLRMLMDQVFGGDNFISDVVWEGVRKNDARFISRSLDYMLIYGRNAAQLSSSDMRWVEKKFGSEQVEEAGRRAWQAAGGDAVKATEELRRWWKTAPLDEATRKNPGLTVFNLVDDARPGEVYSTSPMSSPNPRPNLMYTVEDPGTGRQYECPSNGWRVTADVMASLIERGEVAFGKTTVRRKVYLRGASTQPLGPYFSLNRAGASGYLRKVLGGDFFPNPKDHAVLMRWLGAMARPDATILDFFGGSGSTLEAVERLNAQDGGTRQCILVTNNEVGAKEAKALIKLGHRKGDPEWEAKGVHNWVTKPRIVAVTTGERPDGSRYDDTVDANVEFFDLTYEAPLKVSAHHDFERIAPLLWLRAGATGRRIDALPNGWDVADTYGVIDRLQHTEQFAAALAAVPDARVAFVVTDDERRFQTVVSQLPAGVEPVRLYESYLRNFEIDAARSAR